MKKAFWILFAILPVIALILVGCAGQGPTTAPKTTAPVTTATPPGAPPATAAPPTAAETPIKIGALISLTGAGQIVGPSQKANLEFALEQIGSQAAGRKVQLIMEDDATDPTTGIDKAKKLLQFDKVDVILGPIHGAVGAAVANFMGTTGTPEIIWREKPIEILKGGNNLFLPFGTENGLSYYLGSYVYDKMGYKTAIVAYEDFLAGVNMTQGAAAIFEKKGGNIIQKVPIPPNTMDFSPFLSSMKQADCVIYWFTPPLAQRFTAQYLASGMKMPLVLVLAPQLTSKALADMGDKALGIVGSSHYSFLIDTPINKAYVDSFTKKYGFNLLMEQGLDSYITFNMFIEAVKATKGDTAPAKTIEALKNIKMDTPAGMVSFTPGRLGIGDYYLSKVSKLDDGSINWKVFDKYSQVPQDTPAQ